MVRVATKERAAPIGGFQLVEKLGKGGIGTVYKARRPSGGDFVALKVITGDVVADQVQRSRFAQECQLTQQLSHPHIVRVLDFGLDGNKAYMVMEFVDGVSVGRRLADEGALSESEALRLIEQVGQALHWAHERKLIHRDVKPDNILVTADGKAKLADLGLAKNLESDYNLTRTASCLGTPNFMAPEQFEDPRRADPRSDLYSLAATLYMMLTAQLPFRTRSAMAVAAIYKKQLANDIVPLRQLAPAVSLHVEATIMRAMRANPEERPASVQEFLNELRNAPAAPQPKKKSKRARPEKSDTASGEQRSKKRFACRRSTTCRVSQRLIEESWQGEAVNVSESGLCLELGRRFEPGALITVSLDGDQTRSRLVRIIWVERLDDDHWQLGGKYDQPLCDFEVTELRS